MFRVPERILLIETQSLGFLKPWLDKSGLKTVPFLLLLILLCFCFLFPWKILRFHQTMKIFGQEPSISVQQCSPVGAVAGMLCVPVVPCELTFLAGPHVSWCGMVPSLAETMPRTMEAVSPWCSVRNALCTASQHGGRAGSQSSGWQPLGDTVQRSPSWISRPPATL